MRRSEERSEERSDELRMHVSFSIDTISGTAVRNIVVQRTIRALAKLNESDSRDSPILTPTIRPSIRLSLRPSQRQDGLSR